MTECSDAVPQSHAGPLFSKRAAAGAVNAYLEWLLVVKVVVGNPEPGVFEVNAARWLGCMKHEEDTLASASLLESRSVVAAVSVLLGAFKSSASGATDANVRVPYARLPRVRLQVPLDHDSTGGGTLRLKDQILDLDAAALAGFADLEDRRPASSHR